MSRPRIIAGRRYLADHDHHDHSHSVADRLALGLAAGRSFSAPHTIHGGLSRRRRRVAELIAPPLASPPLRRASVSWPGAASRRMPDFFRNTSAIGDRGNGVSPSAKGGTGS